MYQLFFLFLAGILAMWLCQKLERRFKMGRLARFLVTVLIAALLFIILLWAGVCLSIILFQLNDPVTM